MKGLTIGIVTSNPYNSYLSDMVGTLDARTLWEENNVELLIIGGNPQDEEDDYEFASPRFIPFDEGQRNKGWITRKKNLLTVNARFDTIVYAHDYFAFGKEFITKWLKFIDDIDFDVAVNPIYTAEGARHSDWVVDPFKLWECYPDMHGKNWDVLLPYSASYPQLQYISGNFWVAKKSFMQKFPLDESLVWGDAEDIEWSNRIRGHANLQINMNTSVYIQKPGKWAPNQISDEHLSTLLTQFP